MAKGTGVFQPRYGLMAQQEMKSHNSSAKSSCGPADNAMAPIVLALQQQLHMQQAQASRGRTRRSSVCSISSSCASSGSFTSSGSLSPAAVASPVVSPCHSSSLSALTSPFVTTSMNCVDAPQYQQQALPAPQLCYEPLLVPVDLCYTQRNNQLELQQMLLLQQQEAALDAAISQLLACKQHLATTAPVANRAQVAPLGMPCPFPAPVAPLVPTSSCGPLATAQLLAQQHCTAQVAASDVDPVTAQLLVQLQLEEQSLQAAEEQLQQQLQAEMLHLLDLVA